MINVTEKMKNGLRSFKKYVPADLVSQLIKLNKEAKLGGEKKVMTVFFSDILNFTNFSEKLNLEKLTEYMAGYFESLTAIIVKNKGTIDKYIGDSIMAFWGAPVDMEDHAYHACMAALECQQFLADQSAKFKESGKPDFYTRFGINSGEMIVGNFGYHERFNYTVLGDNVNLASRLEGINKLYATNIIVSEYTYVLIKDRFACRKIDIVAVKGKNTGVPIYELVSAKENLQKEKSDFLNLFNEGMDEYLAKNWKKAISIMEKAKSIVPDDYPADKIIGRCKEYIKNPPPADWDGIYVLKEK
jgi:adenylate cyclase